MELKIKCKSKIKCKTGFSKKGITHVDWVISMGMFLIYVVALFVFLRPGIAVEHKPQNLLNILEKGVKQEIITGIKETPLFVKKCFYQSESNIPSIITVEDRSNKWEFIKIRDEEDREYTAGNTFELKCDEADDTEIQDKTFTLIYRLKEKPNANDDTTPKLFVKCNGYECNENDKWAYAELRATVNSRYVYDKWLDANKWDLGSAESKTVYEKIKEKFGFPKEKNFEVYYNKEGSGEVKITGPAESAPVQENIYIIEWKDSYITGTGFEPKPIIIRIKTW